jgi:hypothetical protein
MSPTDSPPIDLDRLSNAELRGLVVKQWEQIAELTRVVAALREEVARLKGGPPRPNIKPSGMERATEPKSPPDAGSKPRRGPTRAKLTVNEERIIDIVPPLGARFKGYASYVVQDLVIRPYVVDIRRQRWLAADGKMVTAPLPPGIVGHFGPHLRRFVLAAYHQGQATMPRLLTLLRAIGIAISKRELVRLLNAGQERFRDEARSVLGAGLTGSPFITVDDTGARHQATNGYCLHIGNAHFTAFITTAAKSRRNVLEVLRAGHTDYVVNDAALSYMRERSLAEHVIARLLARRKRRFADYAAWTAHLKKLGITALKVSPDPVLIATEGALWGSVKAHGFLPNGVIVSDDAGQFNSLPPRRRGSASTRCVGSMPSASCISSTLSRPSTAPLRRGCAPRSGSSTASSRPTAALRAKSARRHLRPSSTVFSPAAPASSLSTGCWRGFTPTKRRCSRCLSGRKSRCTPTDRKTISAAR